ncbi:MAG: nucleotidyltransferase family protein [Myxococcales bacterium]
MPIRPLSFEPPRVAIDADLAWVLRAAFATDESLTQPSDPQHALEIARATQLSGRVAARLGASRGASLGARSAELSADYYANVAQETLLVQAQHQIADLAERLRIPTIAVKFGGLRLAGVLSIGARAVADLDLLLPQGSARELWRALLAAGFQRTNTHEYPHQLEALRSPFGAVIDLHVHLPGVIVEKGSFASADQLIVHDLVTRNGALLVPNKAVLAAHAIVHALVQNRSTPQTYSSLRMLADLMDLQYQEPQVLKDAARYLAPELRETCDVVERLCIALSNGDFASPSLEGTSEQILLWHCLAGRLDSDYAQRLRAAGLTNKFREGASAVEIAQYLANLLYPAESALDFLYGPAVNTFQRIRRRLHRPIDLAVRVGRGALRGRP